MEQNRLLNLIQSSNNNFSLSSCIFPMKSRTGYYALTPLRACMLIFCIYLIADYEQVDFDSGDEEQQLEQNHRNRRSLSSSFHTASTSIETNDCVEPLNFHSTEGSDNITTVNMGTNAAPPIYDDDRKMASNWDKFRLLMWKNFLLQYRHKIQTIVEIMVPVLFSVILILIRSIVSPDVFPDSVHYKPFEINTLKPLR